MPGLYYEDFKVGYVFKHETGRTVYDYDNILFSTLTMNPQPLHLDEEYSSKTEFGRPLMNSLFTLGLAIGLTVNDTTNGTTIGNLGFENVEFPKPVFAGDTIYVETEVLNKRESKSRPTEGLIFLEHRAKNQRGETVMRCKRTALMKKKLK
ncbi:MaoC family dehydratase [Bacillus sp. 1P10SD]|uniref:MaoC family dehydratase n=1 Tax=Bacillus sp. 1P10SD TaxID=3132265 RepID=UPI0039A42A09